MAQRWGNGDHGPSGDQSWLGGKDRGGSGGWTSDFSSGSSQTDSGVGARRDSQFAEEMAPRFGDITGDETHSHGRDSQSPWMPGFAEQTGQGGGSGRSGDSSMARQLVGVIFSVVVLGIFVVAFLNMGLNWWFLLFAGLPLIMRVVRIIRRNLGD